MWRAKTQPRALEWDTQLMDPDVTAPLHAAGLSKRYGRANVWALDEIDLSIRPGSVTALVGPNGAGKSTLVRTFLGFEAPTKGSVRVCGLDPRKERANALARISYVGQGSPLYSDLTAEEHVAMAASLRTRIDRDFAFGRFDELRISSRIPVRSLSGGQRAQVALAIALATPAPVLILDEPVASLDPFARHEFLTVLGEAVRTRATTVLLASHIVAELELVCDSLVVLSPGRVALDSTIAEAKAAHRVVEQPAAGDDLVSTLSRPDGTRASLIRVASDGNASLEELVLGYLAAPGRAEVAG